MYECFNIKMSFSCLSYRNGKYQGMLNSSLQRHGLGVLVDDDLTFHVSNWHENRMQGPTLLYLAHARYIYGEWKNNEPHGLNVYRSGDTVLLSKYVFGVPSQRCLLIFERHGFACVLAQQGKQWTVIKSGLLVNHTALMKFVELLQVEVPEHYLSLIKFACALSQPHSALRTFPCHQHNCYFGYPNGLAIVFNNNNGLVTVGQHRNEELCQFGGKFMSKKVTEEGNFAASGETVQYKGERPTQRIHQIYQKLHRRDSNFVNESYESKAKIFTSIQSLIINKLKQIVEESRRNQNIVRFDLNESLDYQELDQFQSLKLYQIRDKMYSPPKKIFEKPTTAHTPAKIQSGVSQSHSLLKKSMKKLIGAENIKDPKENKYTPSKVERSRHPSNFTELQRIESNFTENKRGKEKGESAQLLQKANQLYIPAASRKIQQTSRQLNQMFPIQMKLPQRLDRQQANQLEETSSFKRILEEEQKQEGKIMTRKSSQSFQQKKQKKEEENGPNLVSNQKGTPYRRREKSIEQFARPTYEDIEQRRKRILREFSELNSAHPETTPKKQKPKLIDSPYKEHQISLGEDQSSFGYVPLSISTKLNQKRQATGKQEKQERVNNQQQNWQAQRSQQRSSTRRANYNYSGGLDSNNTLGSENREPPIGQLGQLMTVSPVRQKRTYQYMYE